MPNLTRLKRRWKLCTFTGVPLLLLLIATFTGFAGDLATAALTRLPSGSAAFGYGSGVEYYGPTSLEERIVDSDVIARVKMKSVSQAVEKHVYPEVTGPEVAAYAGALEYTFEVLEYLKGSGSSEIVAVVYDLDVEYDTKAGAALGEDFLGWRETQWDGREAIVFLIDDEPRVPSTKQAGRYWLGHLRYQGRDAYTIASRRNKRWLPEDLQAVSAGLLSSVGQRFLTGVPSSEGITSVSVSSMNAENSTITLSELKSLITELQTEVAAGDGSEEYRECVRLKYEREREVFYDMERLAQRGEEYYYMRYDHSLGSGHPMGSVVHQTIWSNYILDEHGKTPPRESGEIWIEGRDKNLFGIEWPGIVSTARPLIVGEYKFYYVDRQFKLIICNALPPEPERKRYEIFVNVTAPVDTLHEAFFDPVAIGTAVGADNANGALKAASFTLEGAGDVSIDRLKWESGQVRMALSPFERLADHHIDFIALDGTMGLRLDFDDAVEVDDGGTRALSWGVCSQPWSAGDLLMLRISASGTNLTSATNDAECIAASPTPTPTSTATPMPTAILTTATPTNFGRALSSADNEAPGKDPP